MLGALPRALALHVGDRVGAMLASVSFHRRAVVAENLRHVVGPGRSATELAAVVRQGFSSYGRYWAESARLSRKRQVPLISDSDIAGRFHLDQAIARGDGVILALPHLGSWEVGGLYLAQQGIPLTTVAEVARPAELFDWFVARRAAIGLTVLPLAPASAARLLRVLRRGGVIALLADRDVVGDGIEVEFFGKKTRLPAGPAMLAVRSNATLLPCAVYQQPGGHYSAIVRAPIDTSRTGRLREDVAKVTVALARELEELIGLAPEQWHVFQPNWPSSGAGSERAFAPVTEAG